MAQVLGELGLQLNEELGGIQMGAGPSSSQPQVSDSAAADADLEARLNNLRRD